MWGAEVQGDAAAFAAAAVGVRAMALAQLRPVAITRGDGGTGTLFGEGLELTVGNRGAAEGTISYAVGGAFDLDVAPGRAAGPLKINESSVVAAALFGEDGERIGWPTHVRFEKGAPVLRFSAWEIAEAADATLAAFSMPGMTVADGWIGRGGLAAPDGNRLAFINREQFAKVDPAAHVDLRPLAFDELSGLHRIDPERPRIWGQHAVRAHGPDRGTDGGGMDPLGALA